MNPDKNEMDEQVRVLNPEAGKAFFSAGWQVEKAESSSGFSKNRTMLIIASSVIMIIAIGAAVLPGARMPSEQTPSVVESLVTGEEDQNNFPFFRGYGSRGIASGSGYPTEWNGADGTNIKWKLKIPNRGKSSPVIWGDKIYLTGAIEGVCEIYCINKQTGELLWTKTADNIPGAPETLPTLDSDGGLAVSTAATNGSSVCAIFANGNLICLDENGERKWARNLGVPENSYGYTSSLLIFQNILIVQYDCDIKVSIIGFNIETGDQLWETPRKGRAAWSSPVLAVLNGIPQIIVNGNPFVSGYDPFTGRELWSNSCMSGDVVPSVAVNSKYVYAVTDYVKLYAIEPGNNAAIKWNDNIFTPDASSPVATDEYLFVTTGNGDVACYNAEKGDTLWTHYFKAPFYASPIIIDNMVYCLDRGGRMHIVSEDARFNIVAEPSLGENTDCTPAFSDKNIFIRAKENLYCIANN